MLGMKIVLGNIQGSARIRQQLIGVTVNPTVITPWVKFGDAASVLTVVDDTAEIAAANLNSIATNGDVYRLDNTAGVTEAFIRWNDNAITMSSGVTWALSCYMRGTGTGRLDVNAGAWSGTATAAFTSGYTRRTSVGTATVETNRFRLGVSAGGVGFFVMMQAEIGGAASAYQLRLS
jgi:hypothetical protein